MDRETLYTASKWDILKELERGPSNPLELSKACGTSIANVSQQLRLLEMAGLVVSERVSNRDKGKPRVLYRLAGNLSYMISTSDNFVKKQLVSLSEYNKIIMRIWFYDDQSLRYPLEKAFWRFEDKLDSLAFLALHAQKKPITFCVQYNDQDDLEPFTITDLSGNTHQVVFTTSLPATEEMYVLYDPDGKAVERERDSNE